MQVNVKELRKVEVEYKPTPPPPPPPPGSEPPPPPPPPPPGEDEKKWNEKQDPRDQGGGVSHTGGLPGGGKSKPGAMKPVLTTAKPTTADALKDLWRQQVESAKDRAAGSMPASLLRAIEILLAPKVDWRQNLRKFAQALANRSEYFLPSRRFLGSGSILWGAKKQKATFETLVIIGDTSGSIAPKELEQFVSEAMDIMKMYNPKDTYLIWCDTTVYEPVDVVKKGEPWKVKHAPGGGGTSFIPPFAWIQKNILGKKKMGPVIFFTDGYPNTGPNGGWPQIDEYGIKGYSNKVLWVIVGQGMPNTDPSIKIPFGTRIDLVM
jgi:hypothetical protein